MTLWTPPLGEDTRIFPHLWLKTLLTSPCERLTSPGERGLLGGERYPDISLPSCFATASLVILEGSCRHKNTIKIVNFKRTLVQQDLFLWKP